MSKSKYDNEFKQEVLILKLDTTYRELEKECYIKQKQAIVIDTNDGVDFAVEEIDTIDQHKMYDLSREIKSNKYLDCASRLVKSQRRKKARIKEKTSDIVLSNYGLFVTLTFNDETMTKTDRDKRRRLVQRYLKENCSRYVANIDFGKEKGREHYHALTDSTLKLDDWHKYGAIKVEHIRATEKSSDKVPQYIAKLTNHAIKETAGQVRLIYSRKPKKTAL